MYHYFKVMLPDTIYKKQKVTKSNCRRYTSALCFLLQYFDSMSLKVLN